uniref:Uncharacterized protein n=1 Tax=Candidozyma auris TaxID=498019 RepID=A0A0L0P8A9_CANAR
MSIRYIGHRSDMGQSHRKLVVGRGIKLKLQDRTRQYIFYKQDNIQVPIFWADKGFFYIFEIWEVDFTIRFLRHEKF